jgi:hypothetical protein
MASAAKLLEQALLLPDNEREDLAPSLLDSLEPSPGISIDDHEELEARAAEARRGVPGFPGTISSEPCYSDSFPTSRRPRVEHESAGGLRSGQGPDMLLAPLDLSCPVPARQVRIRTISGQAPALVVMGNTPEGTSPGEDLRRTPASLR